VNETSAEIKKSLYKEKCKFIMILAVLIVVLIFSILISITLGQVDIKLLEVFKVLVYNIFKLPGVEKVNKQVGMAYEIIWLIRFPRVLLSFIVGMGLSVVGVVMQSIVQNPLADPYTLGISSGASLGATFAILIGVNGIFGPNSVGVMGFLGAFLAAMFVFGLANIKGRASSVKLILSGLVISTICSSFTSFIIYIAPNEQKLRSVTFWLMGSLASATWENILFPLVTTIVGVIYFIFQFRILNLMLMGDETAITLGTDLNKHRMSYILITSFITGVIVSVAGMVGFVGLMVPHVVRIILGTDHKKLVPISALVGAIFLVWTDVMARSLLPNAEMPIGIITSIIGAPFFICLMVKRVYGFGGSE